MAFSIFIIVVVFIVVATALAVAAVAVKTSGPLIAIIRLDISVGYII
jgi:hypothetical protein